MAANADCPTPEGPDSWSGLTTRERDQLWRMVRKLERFTNLIDRAGTSDFAGGDLERCGGVFHPPPQLPAGFFRRLEGPVFNPLELPAGWIAWLPRGLPTGPSTAILSSHDRDGAFAAGDWYEAIRLTALDLLQQGRVLLTGAGMTASPVASTLARRLAIDRITIELSRGLDDLRRKALSWRLADHHTWPFQLVWLGDGQATLELDELVARLARQVRVIHVRGNSRTEAAVRRRLRECNEPGSTWLLRTPANPGADQPSDLSHDPAVVPWLLDHPSGLSMSGSASGVAVSAPWVAPPEKLTGELGVRADGYGTGPVLRHRLYAGISGNGSNGGGSAGIVTEPASDWSRCFRSSAKEFCVGPAV